jgi:hypothetical protein
LFRFGAKADAKSAVMEMLSDVVQRGFERYSAVPDSVVKSKPEYV